MIQVAKQNPMSDMHFYVYDIGTTPMYAPFLENDADIDIDSLMNLEPEFISYGLEFLAANEDDENFEDMKELQLGKIDYLVIGSAGGSVDCYVLVSSPKMYKAFVEYMLTNPVLDSLVKADADYIIDNIRNEDAFVFIQGKPHMPIVNRKGKLPTHDSTRHNPMSKYTLYRGTPYSGLDLDDLKGRGGHGQEMLGRGLYCTDEYHVAADYAQGGESCVYELELNIPDDQILEINPHTTNVGFLNIESANSIERDFFGLTAPAFTLKIKDRNTGEDFTYLISEYEDVLEYEEDLKRAIAVEILSQYGLYTSDYNDEWDSDWGTWEIRDYLTEVFEALEDPDFLEFPEVQAYSRHLESLKQKLASQSDDVEEYIIELLENEYIQKIRERHYPYYEDDTVLWGGDSTELAGIARQHGYKVLWCSDWISSGNEVVIVDDSIYNNGLVIVDDCSED